MALYRKYRPQKFMDLVGQEHVKRTLTNALVQDKVGHAYLFSGPRGTGKTTVARLLAKALNCQKKLKTKNEKLKTIDYEPCNECQSCIEIKNDRSLDVMEIDAASNRGIDEIRELRDKIKYAPTAGRYKIYIIDEVHMLTREAFNALLKTLEEPPKHAVFVMATTELHKVPDTILSRTQQFDFKRASAAEIITNLAKIIKAEKLHIQKEAIDLIAQLGDGSFRDATSILDQVSSLDKEIVTLKDVQEILGIVEDKVVGDLLELIFDSKSQGAIELINKIYSDGYDLVEFGNRIVEYLRKILLRFQIYDLRFTISEEEMERIKNLSERLEIGEILEIINRFLEAVKETKTASIPQLPLELAVLELTEGKRLKVKGESGESGTENQKSGIKNYELSEKTREHENIKTLKHENKETEKLRNIETKEQKGKNQELKIENPKSEIINLKSRWPEVIEALRPENHSLSLLVSESEPLEIKDDKLILSVKYKFYAERIREPKKYEILTSVLEKVLGQRLAVECVVSSHFRGGSEQTDHPRGGQMDSSGVEEVDSIIAPEEAASDDLLADAVEVFGT